ncbi:TetR/AcrR family transcriptional regulator [Ferrimonas aestuarii]|uniref:TetR/AcrR family transcriptional regulator n=1 Tax=Ferrimonas aestuarii TaxID=2569539 RepID=A0A4U1BRE6_9GAMM|nr:TetR/AcrR family transcriptional regulator [Ferrimonas aestuarii]
MLLQTVEQQLIEQGILADPQSPRGRLLAHAAKLFRNKGYQSTTVRDIAAAVGILSGSIFHHYKNKDAILKAVMLEGIYHSMGQMHAALEQAQGPKGKLRALIACELDSMNGSRGDAMTVVVNEWRFLSDGGQADILSLREEYEQLWISVLEQAFEQELLQCPPSVMRKLLYGAITWTDKWFRPDGELSEAQLIDEILKLAIR